MVQVCYVLEAVGQCQVHKYVLQVTALSDVYYYCISCGAYIYRTVFLYIYKEPT